MIVVGLGGNVGGEDAVMTRFAAAAAAFRRWGDVRASRVYRTAPIGPAQDDFLNAAIAVTCPGPEEMAAEIRAIERAHGRVRDERWGPRTIDLDVLVWGHRVLHGELEVPHPRLAHRRFALAPLADLVGEDFAVPGMGRVGDLLRAVADQDVTVTPRTIA
jgi:2-amino-4-hydroxy-6-hydroxymethyldihydropteridine diphosphokinase